MQRNCWDRWKPHGIDGKARNPEWKTSQRDLRGKAFIFGQREQGIETIVGVLLESRRACGLGLRRGGMTCIQTIVRGKGIMVGQGVRDKDLPSVNSGLQPTPARMR